jgi:hypothetical protein
MLVSSNAVFRRDQLMQSGCVYVRSVELLLWAGGSCGLVEAAGAASGGCRLVAPLLDSFQRVPSML